MRKTVLQERMSQADSVVREKSLLIARRVLEIEELLLGDTVLAYADFRKEVETGRIITKLLEMGKRVAVPLTVPKQRLLIPSLLLDYPGDLQPGSWGILEPKPDCLRPLEPEVIDAVLVPGVVFDITGNRLGYGGGYYDRFLPRLSNKAVLIAPAFELQVKQSLEPGVHDVPVHYIVTEDRVIGKPYFSALGTVKK